MIVRQRFILYALNAVMAALLLASIVGSGIMAHIQAQDATLSQPDPAVARLLAP